MDANKLMKILGDCAYVRTGGTKEELCCANYILNQIEEFGLQGYLQPFEVPLAEIEQAELWVDGKQIPCTGYQCAGDWDVEAPLYYLRHTDEISLKNCRGKIVLTDSLVGYWKYQDLMDHGAVGYITCNGNVFFQDRDIDQLEQRGYVSQGRPMAAVNIHAADAIRIVREKGSTARIRLRQKQWTGHSHNVILDIPGESEEYIAFTAHYDSKPLAVGVYDNMSGAAGLLYLAEYFASHPQHFGLKFIWCGSEERGLLGAKYFCGDPDRIKNCILNINLDMIGCLMGRFITCVTAGERVSGYINCLSSELGFQNDVYSGVYSSDSTPFADRNVPAVSFARIAPRTMAGYHDRYDTIECMDGDQMVEDFEFVLAFAKRIAAARYSPFPKEMPEDLRKQLDHYLGIKRTK